MNLACMASREAAQLDFEKQLAAVQTLIKNLGDRATDLEDIMLRSEAYPVKTEQSLHARGCCRGLQVAADSEVKNMPGFCECPVLTRTLLPLSTHRQTQRTPTSRMIRRSGAAMHKQMLQNEQNKRFRVEGLHVPAWAYWQVCLKQW